MTQSTEFEPEPTPAQHLFRRGTSWIRKTGIGATGKKAKRLVHRRNRHDARNLLRNLSLS